MYFLLYILDLMILMSAHIMDQGTTIAVALLLGRQRSEGCESIL